MKWRPVALAKAAVYWAKSTRFAATARLAVEHGHWDAAVSSAVHAAISGLDALCVARLGRRAASDEHQDALQLVDEMESLPPAERDALARHARALLALKHLAEYEDRLCEEREARRALDQVERLRGRLAALMRGAGI